MKTKLKQWGAVLMVFGAASLILPLIGMQLQIFNLFGEAQRPAGIAALVLGAVMWFIARTKEQKSIDTSSEGVGAPPTLPVKGPSGYAAGGTATPGTATCPNCGAPANPGDRFCMECGGSLAQATPVRAAPVPVAPRRSRKLGRKVFLVMLLALVAAGAWYFFGSPKSYTLPTRSAPALPPRLAGTITEFPVDTLGAAGKHPVSVVSQTFGPASQGQAQSSATPSGPYTPPPPPLGSSASSTPSASSAPGIQAPADTLPPGLDTNSIPQVASAMTSSTYRGGDPQAAPVHVHVIHVGNITITAQWAQGMARSSGASLQGARVQSPQGQTYDGYTLRSPTTLVYLLNNPQTGNVIILYTPQTDGFTAVQRLAGSVGNGRGLYDYPQVLDTYTTLPATPPAGYQLTRVRSFTGDELRAMLTQTQAQMSREAAEAVNRIFESVRILIPERGVMALYNNGQNQEKGVLVGSYGSPRKAKLAWSALAWSFGWGMEKNKTLGFDAMAINDENSRILLFQKGPYIGLTQVPRSSSEQELLDLTKSLQL